MGAIRYFDPSYQVRSSPANSNDSIRCDLLARHAVHVAMAGKTGLIIGHLHYKFIHVPIELLVGRKETMDVKGFEWNATLATTVQPEQLL